MNNSPYLDKPLLSERERERKLTDMLRQMLRTFNRAEINPLVAFATIEQARALLRDLDQ